MRGVLSAFVVILLAATMPSRASDFDGLDALVRKTKDATGFQAGTAIIAIKDGRVVHEAYFGYADIGARTPVDRDTAFYIASATKPFFAIDVLLQQERGTIDATTNMQAMFPDIAFEGFDARAVTLRDLLTHTSGVDNTPLVWATAYVGQHDAVSRRALVALTSADADTAHGAFDYSNVGYNIASVWLDATLGTPWQARLDADIFAPLGMHRTTASIDTARAAGWSVARPYSAMAADRNTPLYLEKSDDTMHAAGGMIASAPDLARFLVAQMATDGPLPAAVIKRSQVQQVPTDGVAYEDFARSGYAWGWYVGEYKGRRMLHHFGGFAGFHAHLSFVPEAGVGLVVLNNEDFLAARLSSLIADYAYGVLLDEEGTDARVAARFDALIDKARGLDAAVAAQQAKLRGRASSLSLSPAEYTGTYMHPLLGDIAITRDAAGESIVRWGRLTSTALAYDDKDTIRVEWVPNNGSVIAFEVGAGRVDALRFEGMRFVR